MNLFTIGLFGLILLFSLVLLGIHVGIALGLVGFIGLASIVGIERALSAITQRMYFSNANYALVTLPLFILMGLLAASGGIGTKLYNSLSIWTRKIKGGLGISTILGCAAFGTICGSSFVTAAVFAKVSAPEMRRHGYNKILAYGLCASAGIIGMMIPPSVLAVIYGILSGLSIGNLLIAGLGPGILLTIFFSLFIHLYAIKRPDLIVPEKNEGTTFTDKIKSLPAFWPVVVIGFIVFGGIFLGVFSPTESAAIATVVVIFILFFIERKSFLEMLLDGLKETAVTSAMIFLTMAGASVFSQFLVITGISQKIVSIIINANLSNNVLLIIISLIFIFLGTFMDSTSILTITIPLLCPMINTLGINPYFYAILAIYSSQIGIITPPFGLSVFTVKSVAEKDVTIEDIFKGSAPFLFVMIIVLLLMIAFPQIVTFLIN